MLMKDICPLPTPSFYFFQLGLFITDNLNFTILLITNDINYINIK